MLDCDLIIIIIIIITITLLMMLRIYEEADWPNMEERNTEGTKYGDRKRTATKYDISVNRK